MHAPHLPPLQSLRLDPLDPGDADILLAGARQLQEAVPDAGVSRPLRGKNLGLLCDSDEADDAALFRLAAESLGARVAHVRPSLDGLGLPEQLAHTARMMGRLYDAIECQGLPRDLVRQLGEQAGVPVYDGLASPAHPTARLVERFGEGVPRAAARRLVIQAALMTTLL